MIPTRYLSFKLVSVKEGSIIKTYLAVETV